MEELLKYANRIIDFERGEVLFSEGEECTGVGLIIKGEIKISIVTDSDHEEAISFIKQDEMFGNNLVFSSSPFYLGDVIGEKKGQMAFFKKEEIIKILQIDQIILTYFLRQISDKAIAIKLQNKMLAHKNIRDRIMFYLLQEAKRQKSKSVFIKNYTTLAIILSLPRPSLARELTKMDQDGLIIKNKHTITIK